MSDTMVMVLPDGRELAWLEVGDPKGPAVIVFHGTPGSRLQVSFDEEPITAAGVRFIAVDRPGYGHSSYQPARRLTDWVSDVSCLADHLNIEKFSVVGISGGGPQAAVCARFLADRVLSAAIVSGVGPLAENRTEDGMMGFNRLIVRLARKSQYLVYPTFALSASLFRRWPERALQAASGQLPKSDMEVLSTAEGEISLHRELPTVLLDESTGSSARLCSLLQ
jgi:pimeloyl-ACP methyl ester carboxylesterase